jgi:hypothetical protein
LPKILQAALHHPWFSEWTLYKGNNKITELRTIYTADIYIHWLVQGFESFSTMLGPDENGNI